MYFSLFLSFSSAQLWVPVISAWAKPASRSVSTSTTWIWRTSQTRPCVSRLPPVRFRQDRTSCLYSLLMNSRPTNINVLNVHSWWWWKRESGGGGGERGGDVNSHCMKTTLWVDLAKSVIPQQWEVMSTRLKGLADSVLKNDFLSWILDWRICLRTTATRKGIWHRYVSQKVSVTHAVFLSFDSGRCASHKTSEGNKQVNESTHKWVN